MRYEPVDCDCAACRAMCADSTCMPTPDEVRDLIRAGFAARLACYEPRGRTEHAFIAPAPDGQEGAVLATTHSGRCTFFDGSRCELHGRGLKPLEGRLARHDRPWPDVRRQVYLTWAGKRYQSVRIQMQKSLPPVGSAGASTTDR